MKSTNTKCEMINCITLSKLTLNMPEDAELYCKSNAVNFDDMLTMRAIAILMVTG